MSPRLRAMLFEAVAALAWARLVVAFRLRWGLPWALRGPSADSLAPSPKLGREVCCVIRMAANAVPWKSVCLPNAMAARLMLQRRGFASTMHLGVGKHAAGALHAHAWLEAGGIIIAGAEGVHTVVPLPTQPLLRPEL